MNKKTRIFAVTLLLSAGCAGQATPIPEPESVSAIRFAGRCGMCHSVPHPKRNTIEQWENLMGVMEGHLVTRELPALTDDDRELILSYLRKHAR